MARRHKMQEQQDILVDQLTSDSLVSQIVVLNDDYNTFEWVITCFIEILQHSNEQSEQLALIIHTKGRASVKVGSIEQLQPLKDALVDRGLNAIIEHEKVSR